MPTTTTAETPLIDDGEFLEELERFEQADEPSPEPVHKRQMYADAFDALETGLPTSQGARPLEVRQHERAPSHEPFDPLIEQPAPAEIHIPVVAAALVLVACLTAGAAMAAFVFHDRVTQITALRPATR